MYEWQIIGLLLSVLFSFLMILFVQWIKKPVIEVKIGDYSYHNQDRMKIAHVKVRNKPVSTLRRFMNRDLATNCRAQIEVRDATNEQPMKQFPELKWALNPEPLRYEWVVDQGRAKALVFADPVVMMTTGLKNIGERWEDLDIAVKHHGDEEFYVNTPRNYPLNAKPKETRIDARRVVLVLKVDYDNGSSRPVRFYLRNGSEKITDFELSETPLW